MENFTSWTGLSQNRPLSDLGTKNGCKQMKFKFSFTGHTCCGACEYNSGMGGDVCCMTEMNGRCEESSDCCEGLECGWQMMANYPQCYSQEQP